MVCRASVFAADLDQKGFVITQRGIKRKCALTGPSDADNVSDRHIGGTPGFTAPELLVPNQEMFLLHRNNLACDMFSVGMSILCFLVKSYIYHQNNSVYKSRKVEREEIKKLVQPKVIDKKIKKYWSKEEYNVLEKLGLINLLYKCLEHNPSNRITAAEALRLLSKK